MFIVLTQTTGERIAVNVDHIITVAAAGSGSRLELTRQGRGLEVILEVKDSLDDVLAQAHQAEKGAPPRRVGAG